MRLIPARIPSEIALPDSWFGILRVWRPETGSQTWRLSREVRSATVRAHGEAKALKVDKKTLLRRIKEDPLLAVNLLQTMSHRVRDLNAQLAILKGDSS